MFGLRKKNKVDLIFVCSYFTEVSHFIPVFFVCLFVFPVLLWFVFDLVLVFFLFLLLYFMDMPLPVLCLVPPAFLLFSFLFLVVWIFVTGSSLISFP